MLFFLFINFIFAEYKHIKLFHPGRKVFLSTDGQRIIGHEGKKTDVPPVKIESEGDKFQIIIGDRALCAKTTNAVGPLGLCPIDGKNKYFFKKLEPNGPTKISNGVGCIKLDKKVEAGPQTISLDTCHTTGFAKWSFIPAPPPKDDKKKPDEKTEKRKPVDDKKKPDEKTEKGKPVDDKNKPDEKPEKGKPVDDKNKPDEPKPTKPVDKPVEKPVDEKMPDDVEKRLRSEDYTDTEIEFIRRHYSLWRKSPNDEIFEFIRENHRKKKEKNKSETTKQAKTDDKGTKMAETSKEDKKYSRPEGDDDFEERRLRRRKRRTKRTKRPGYANEDESSSEPSSEHYSTRKETTTRTRKPRTKKRYRKKNYENDDPGLDSSEKLRKPETEEEYYTRKTRKRRSPDDDRVRKYKNSKSDHEESEYTTEDEKPKNVDYERNNKYTKVKKKNGRFEYPSESASDDISDHQEDADTKNEKAVKTDETKVIQKKAGDVTKEADIQEKTRLKQQALTNEKNQDIKDQIEKNQNEKDVEASVEKTDKSEDDDEEKDEEALTKQTKKSKIADDSAQLSDAKNKTVIKNKKAARELTTKAVPKLKKKKRRKMYETEYKEIPSKPAVTAILPRYSVNPYLNSINPPVLFMPQQESNNAALQKQAISNLTTALESLNDPRLNRFKQSDLQLLRRELSDIEGEIKNLREQSKLEKKDQQADISSINKKIESVSRQESKNNELVDISNKKIFIDQHLNSSKLSNESDKNLTNKIVTYKKIEPQQIQIQSAIPQPPVNGQIVKTIACTNNCPLNMNIVDPIPKSSTIQITQAQNAQTTSPIELGSISKEFRIKHVSADSGDTDPYLHDDATVSTSETNGHVNGALKKIIDQFSFGEITKKITNEGFKSQFEQCDNPFCRKQALN
ncbi:hypothetical protein M153_3420007701 [Pseudoloma neurophilia]|uniref:Uncharacterized protein n=1 Tax=Pseudoloma neurophilia TaxID=146866 RepID=A0A0R0LY10_9MICR|nr:hypothetical protein M153_3420007701 [Pseudoloma neurophilia]